MIKVSHCFHLNMTNLSHLSIVMLLWFSLEPKKSTSEEWSNCFQTEWHQILKLLLAWLRLMNPKESDGVPKSPKINKDCQFHGSISNLWPKNVDDPQITRCQVSLPWDGLGIWWRHLCWGLVWQATWQRNPTCFDQPIIGDQWGH